MRKPPYEAYTINYPLDSAVDGHAIMRLTWSKPWAFFAIKV